MVEYLEGKKKQTYVGQVGPQKNADYEVKFMRKVDEIGKAFIFPEKADVDLFVQRSQIVRLLDEPHMDNKFKYWFKDSVAVYK